MRRRIRLSESDLHRVIRESVKRVLRESTRPRRGINEVSTSLIRRAKHKAFDKGKYAQSNRFDDEYWNRTVDRLAKCQRWWNADMEWDIYRNLIPNLDDYLKNGDLHELADRVIMVSDWSLDEWNEYLNDGYVSDDDEEVDLTDY